MAKWTLPEGRKPLTTMESADLVLRMHKKLEAGFSRGDRIAALEEMVEACKADAQEAEAYAAELEARLAKAASELEEAWRVPRSDASYGILQVMIKYALSELKGQNDE